jgi:hypothetical protein
MSPQRVRTLLIVKRGQEFMLLEAAIYAVHPPESPLFSAVFGDYDEVLSARYNWIAGPIVPRPARFPPATLS